jgi:protein-tyrosine phosphatase
MLSDVYWIKDVTGPPLGIMARPRSGDWLEDEISHWAREGVELVVSLLESEEVDELGLGNEAALCRENAIGFMSFPIVDRGLPGDEAAFRSLITELAGTQKAIAIHCRAGIGRSSLAAAALLIARGTSADDALAAIERARGVRVPDTDEQRAWIGRFAGE